MIITCLSQYLTDTASTGSSPSFLTALYQKLFGSAAQQNIVRFNDFTDVATYFLQKVCNLTDVDRVNSWSTFSLVMCYLATIFIVGMYWEKEGNVNQLNWS